MISIGKLEKQLWTSNLVLVLVLPSARLGGIEYFTSWEPILSAKNYVWNRGSQMWQKTSKKAVIWVFLVAWNSFPWQKISFCDKKFLLMPRNLFLWKDISTSDKKFLPMTRNFFLQQEISSCDKKFLPLIKDSFL